jgi:hypothetical protein
MSTENKRVFDPYYLAVCTHHSEVIDTHWIMTESAFVGPWLLDLSFPVSSRFWLGRCDTLEVVNSQFEADDQADVM